MTEIATAYVRVRPNTTGFAAETQQSLKAPLLSLGKFITGALAIKGGFDLGKAILGDAAQVQKSSEVIRSEFGKSGQAIIDFADKGGVALGLSGTLALESSAKFGVLFHNIGLGKDQAGAMTLNLEKLAASIAAVTGKDPGEILGTLPLALAGSVRGLKELGFVITPVALKQEALKLGLISTIKQGLDPGAKAIAIYALLTKDLGQKQTDAAQHSGDLLNVERRLGAEWDHAKGVLGEDLIPLFARYGSELSDFIERETKSGQLQRDFNVIAKDTKIVVGDVVTVFKDLKGVVTTFDDLVGGNQNGVKIFADAFLLLYTRSKLIKWGFIESSVAAVGTKAKTSAGEVGLLEGSLLKLKGIGPIAIAIALDFIPKAKPSSDPNAPSQNPVAKAFTKIPLLGGLFSQTNRLADSIDNFLGLTGGGAKANPRLPTGSQIRDQIANENAYLKDGLKKRADLLSAAAKATAAATIKKETAVATTETALTQLKSAAAVANEVASQQLSDAKFQVEQARQTLTDAIAASKQAVADSITSAKQNLNQIAASIAGSVTGAGGALPLGGVLGKRLKELQARIKAGKNDVTTQQLALELQNQIAAKANLGGGTLQTRLANLADLFNKGAISGKTADIRLDQILKSAGVNAAIIQRGQGVAAADQFRAEVAAFKAQVAAEAAGPKQKGTGFEVTIVKPLEVLRQQEKIVAADAHAVGTAQLTVLKASIAEQKVQTDYAKKQTKLLAKIAAAQPSKHDTAALDAFLKSQGSAPDAKDAKAAARGRNHR